ncbi:transposable element Tcb2 transposase [Trichonephila clavipes]|nr:transposable element Tcb2 transposase [Trichonephila clavipes]
MQRDCALSITGRGRLTSFSVDYKTGNQSLLSDLNHLQKKSRSRHAITPFLKYKQLSQFEIRRIIGMREAGWSARQLGLSDCVLKKCWDQWIREMSFTRRPGSGRPRQTSRREDRHIVRNTREQPTASLAAIQAQVAPSLGAPESSRTIRRSQAEEHLGSRRLLRVLPLTPTHRRLRLEWCRARGNWTAAEWNQVVCSNESRFNLSRVWRPRGERLNPVFALQRHTTPTAGVKVWGVIAYNTRSPLVLIHGTITAQRYVHDILQSLVLPLMQRPLGAIFLTMLGLTRQCCHKTVSALLLPFLGQPDPQICLQSSISGIILDGELGIPGV